MNVFWFHSDLPQVWHLTTNVGWKWDTCYDTYRERLKRDKCCDIYCKRLDLLVSYRVKNKKHTKLVYIKTHSKKCAKTKKLEIYVYKKNYPKIDCKLIIFKLLYFSYFRICVTKFNLVYCTTLIYYALLLICAITYIMTWIVQEYGYKWNVV